MAQKPLEWATALCEALGLDGRHIRRIELVLDAHEAVTVKIYPDKSAAVVELLKEAGKHVKQITVVDSSGGELDAL